MADEVRAKAATGIAVATTTDGQHVMLGINDIAGDRHNFAVPRLFVVELMGRLAVAFSEGGRIIDKPEQRSVLHRVERADVGCSDQERLHTIAANLQCYEVALPVPQ